MTAQKPSILHVIHDFLPRHRAGSEIYAAALVQQALIQTPDSAAVLDSMGWALHKQGKHGEAIDYLERARKNGADPEIDLHLGEVQWDLNEKTAARETWKKALERWPEDKRLKERLERAGP